MSCTDELVPVLKKLRLSGLLHTLELRIRQAVDDGLPFEEFLFRGIAYQGLRRTLGPGLAALGSAALFALVHPPAAMAPVFLLGVACAVGVQRTGSLAAAILTHAIYNLGVLGVEAWLSGSG